MRRAKPGTTRGATRHRSSRAALPSHTATTGPRLAIRRPYLLSSETDDVIEPQILEAADRWWARDFACEPEALRPTATLFLTVVGPASIAYGKIDGFNLSSASIPRRLTPADATAVARLREACSEEEWEHGGSDQTKGPTFGAFDQTGRLCALAGYEIWNSQIAHLSIVSASDCRGHGLGQAAVAFATQDAVRAGLIPQYRTLIANTPSMAIARRLGFEDYGFTVYVRLGS